MNRLGHMFNSPSPRDEAKRTHRRRCKNGRPDAGMRFSIGYAHARRTKRTHGDRSTFPNSTARVGLGIRAVDAGRARAARLDLCANYFVQSRVMSVSARRCATLPLP